MAGDAAFVVIVGMQTQPGKRQEALDVMEKCLVETHKEDGCLSYALHLDTGDENKFVLVERWRSQADIDEHMKTPHIAELFGNIGSLLDGPPSMSFTTPYVVGDPAKGSL